MGFTQAVIDGVSQDKPMGNRLEQMQKHRLAELKKQMDFEEKVEGVSVMDHHKLESMEKRRQLFLDTEHTLLTGLVAKTTDELKVAGVLGGKRESLNVFGKAPTAPSSHPSSAPADTTESDTSLTAEQYFKLHDPEETYRHSRLQQLFLGIGYLFHRMTHRKKVKVPEQTAHTGSASTQTEVCEPETQGKAGASVTVEQKQQATAVAGTPKNETTQKPVKPPQKPHTEPNNAGGPARPAPEKKDAPERPEPEKLPEPAKQLPEKDNRQFARGATDTGKNPEEQPAKQNLLDGAEHIVHGHRFQVPTSGKTFCTIDGIRLNASYLLVAMTNERMRNRVSSLDFDGTNLSVKWKMGDQWIFTPAQLTALVSAAVNGRPGWTGSFDVPVSYTKISKGTTTQENMTIAMWRA